LCRSENANKCGFSRSPPLERKLWIYRILEKNQRKYKTKEDIQKFAYNIYMYSPSLQKAKYSSNGELRSRRATTVCYCCRQLRKTKGSHERVVMNSMRESCGLKWVVMDSEHNKNESGKTQKNVAYTLQYIRYATWISFGFTPDRNVASRYWCLCLIRIFVILLTTFVIGFPHRTTTQNIWWRYDVSLLC
jgi:hypothetical protein